MNASTYQNLLHQVFTPELPQLENRLRPLYTELETALEQAKPGRKSQDEVSFRFERLRLGIGITLMQLLTDLGGDEDSTAVQDLLEDALEAPNVAEIDRVIQKKNQVFEDLFTDLFVNPEAEEVLALFERTLHASSKQETDAIIQEARELAQDLEIQPDQGAETEETD